MIILDDPFEKAAEAAFLHSSTYGGKSILRMIVLRTIVAHRQPADDQILECKLAIDHLLV